MLCPTLACVLPALLNSMLPPGPQQVCVYWQCGMELLFAKLVDREGLCSRDGGVLPGMWDLHMCLSFLGLLHSLFGGAVKDCRKSLPPRPPAFHHLMSVPPRLTGVHRLNSDQ